MSRASTTAPGSWPVEIPDEWMAACGARPDQTAEDPARVPRALELALIRGLLEERSLSPEDAEPRWTAVGRIAANLTIWGFVAYGLWTLLG